MPDIKLYLAVLNKGWLRREIAYLVIPAMQATEGVQVYWENPAKTWANPISVNRNLITKRFLASDCDCLMMIDNDVVPLHNPAEMVFADKDIIGSPAKVRQKGQAINWTAYIKPKGRDGYVAVDFGLIKDTVDLQQVDVVGTGCILIKRKVLEVIKAPFSLEFDEDGIDLYGTDFAFCRKAAAAGFEVYTTTERVCEHFKEQGFLERDAWDDSDNRDPTAWKYQLSYGDMKITQKDWHFIKYILKREKPKRVLEFGCGLSSLMMSETVPVLSFETDSEHRSRILAKCNGNLLKVRMWNGKEIKRLGRYDLAFVDGPVGASSGGMGRQHSIRLAAKHSDRIIIHDAGRSDEMHWQEKYLRGKFQRIAKSGHHQTRCHYWVKKVEK